MCCTAPCSVHLSSKKQEQSRPRDSETAGCLVASERCTACAGGASPASAVTAAAWAYLHGRGQVSRQPCRERPAVGACPEHLSQERGDRYIELEKLPVLTVVMVAPPRRRPFGARDPHPERLEGFRSLREGMGVGGEGTGMRRKECARLGRKLCGRQRGIGGLQAEIQDRMLAASEDIALPRKPAHEPRSVFVPPASPSARKTLGG